MTWAPSCSPGTRTSSVANAPAGIVLGCRLMCACAAGRREQRAGGEPGRDLLRSHSRFLLLAVDRPAGRCRPGPGHAVRHGLAEAASAAGGARPASAAASRAPPRGIGRRARRRAGSDGAERARRGRVVRPSRTALAGIAPSASTGAQAAGARKATLAARPGRERRRATATRREPERQERAHPSRGAHRIGTFTMRLFDSNSETRSTTSSSHVPPGLSTAELRM